MTGDPATGPVDERTLRRVAAFLYYEAELLDDGEFENWLGVLTDDVRYRMPVRITRERRTEDEFSTSLSHFDETRQTLGMRVARLCSATAWAEKPPSRTRHFVTNIRVVAATETAIEVRSNLLLYRNRGDSPDHDLLSAERHDCLRDDGNKLKLASRLILLDQSTIPTLNLAIFL